MKRFFYNTWYFFRRTDGKHSLPGYLRWMQEVM